MTTRDVKAALAVAGIGGAAILLLKHFGGSQPVVAPQAAASVVGPVAFGGGDASPGIQVPEWRPLQVANGDAADYPAGPTSFPSNFNVAGSTYTYNLGPGSDLTLPILQPVGNDPGTAKIPTKADAADAGGCCCDSNPCGGGGVEPSSSLGALIRSVQVNNPDFSQEFLSNIMSTRLIGAAA